MSREICASQKDKDCIAVQYLILVLSTKLYLFVELSDFLLGIQLRAFQPYKLISASEAASLSHPHIVCLANRCSTCSNASSHDGALIEPGPDILQLLKIL